ncbi:hypothetical protein I7I50_07698 [Histoplasma capsulatum G186AR]|uniref:Uncharacterized protein n=1 Tax=Ajellomyces capsulatus TaxID=5037 RepID=A0A8H7YZM8_AJECA|nr:hypothetical protein I7I52_09230 [Histoplasma capsulatum]QSS68328.1 hypothetical protein I7I50_07698 [Histoplasma capsulatum G186AR]
MMARKLTLTSQSAIAGHKRGLFCQMNSGGKIISGIYLTPTFTSCCLDDVSSRLRRSKLNPLFQADVACCSTLMNIYRVKEESFSAWPVRGPCGSLSKTIDIYLFISTLPCSATHSPCHKTKIQAFPPLIDSDTTHVQFRP